MKYIILLFFALIFISCHATQSSSLEYKVLINGNKECMYDYGEEDFCSKENLKKYQSIKGTINFDNNKTLVAPTNNQGYIVVIDPVNKKVFPFKYLVDYQKIEFNKGSNRFCIDGYISAYRDEASGYICFDFTENNFERVYK